MDEEVSLEIHLHETKAAPGASVTGWVAIAEGSRARSLDIDLINAEWLVSKIPFGGTAIVSAFRLEFPEGLSEFRRVYFSLDLPLSAAPAFATRALIGVHSRSWAVRAKVDRPGRDWHTNRELQVVAAPPDRTAASLVLPGELADAQSDGETGVNTLQVAGPDYFSGTILARQARRPTAEHPGLIVECHEPIARRGTAVLVDVSSPDVTGRCIGLICYQRRFNRGQYRGAAQTREYTQIWATWLALAQGNYRYALSVPPNVPPTRNGEYLSIWWDVRPGLGDVGAPQASQSISRPVIIRA